MYTVTQRVKMVKQLPNGYIKVKDFDHIQLDDKKKLNQEECIQPNVMGSLIDYLFRWYKTKDVEKAFDYGIRGLNKVNPSLCNQLINQIVDLSDESLLAAAKLASWDSNFRAGVQPQPINKLDKKTADNIRIMLDRCIEFEKIYGPVLNEEVTFGDIFSPAYDGVIKAGDGDFMTEDTLWDMKVSKYKITPQHTLQIMVYYLMAKRSKLKKFDNINKVGFFNPRLNTVYVLDALKIDPGIIYAIYRNVIGYKEYL